MIELRKDGRVFYVLLGKIIDVVRNVNIKRTNVALPIVSVNVLRIVVVYLSLEAVLFENTHSYIATVLRFSVCAHFPVSQTI